MNATAIATGGYSTARQFDCGTCAGADGGTIAFHFTFANTPNVVCSLVGTWGNAYLLTTTPYNITTSGFTLSSHYIQSGNATVVSNGANTITWIAIG